MARRDPVRIRLITRKGNDWTARYPLVAEAVNHLKVRSCLIDGEVVCCDEKGVAAFQLLCPPKRAAGVSVCIRPARTERRGPAQGPDRSSKGDAGQHPAESRPGVRLNEHLEHPEGGVVFQHACKMGLEGIVSKRLGSRYRSGRSPDWLKFKNPLAPAVKRKRIGRGDAQLHGGGARARP
jgi:bifunctional non-homologous end joining protein LigD